MKKCSSCKIDKDLACFSKAKKARDGLQCQCKDCSSSAGKLWRTNNPERASQLSARWAKKNRKIATAGVLEWQRNNREKARAFSRDFYYQNKPYMMARSAERRARKMRQTLPLTKEQRREIGNLYLLAARMTKETGIVHHVDHIVPLKGVTVRGLHVPWNLRVISAFDNMSKGNKFDHS